jgi:predicted Zn-dependent peptidase
MPRGPRTHADGYQCATLANGLGLVVKPMPQAQSVSVGIWVRAGGRYEPAAKAGISHFLEHLLFKGTLRRSCEQLKQAIEGVGGSLNGFTAEEFTCYLAKVPSRYGARATEVLADMVRSPRFRPDDIEKEREVILEEIRMYEDSPGQFVHDLFNQLLWPEHPLGMLLSGTTDTVRGITRAELVEYWRAMYQPRGFLVACAGAVEAPALERRIRGLFGSMRAHSARRFGRAPRPHRGPRVKVWHKDTEQAHLCLGTHAVPRTHPDRFALELLHVLLGGNMSSRLFREVRERRGLVYEIGSQIKRYADTGAFVISAGCDPGKLTPTLRTILDVLREVRRGAIPRAELRRAKEYYAGQLLMGLEDTMDHMLWVGEQAVTVGRIGAAERLLKQVEQVRPMDLRRVARRLFLAAKLHVAVIGPVREAEMAALTRRSGLP